MIVILVEQEMIQEKVPQGLFEPTWGPDRIANFSVPKKHRK
jgi:hypothetical protein